MDALEVRARGFRLLVPGSITWEMSEMAGAEGKNRVVRVAGRIREELSTLILQQLRDPRLARVMISRTEISSDLQVARIWVRLTHEDSPQARKDALKALKSASNILRKALGAKLELRRTPELHFEFDEGMDAQQKIEALLDEIKKETRD